MSMHIEWGSTGENVAIYGPGSWFSGYDEPVTECGVLIGGDGGGAFMMEGSPEGLLAWSQDLTARLEKLVANPPAPANGHVWNEHDNEIGDGCPHSGDPVSVDLDVNDESIACPARCPDSEAVQANSDEDPLDI